MNRISEQFLILMILCVKFLSSQYNFRVSENQPINTIVGQVLIKSGFSYEFFHKEGLFNLNKHTGVILTRNMIDRESLASDLIEIFLYKKTLEGQFLETISIKVRIIDENDNPPIFYPNKLERRIIENIALLTDVSLTAATDSDTDEFGVSNNYKIESGNEDERFALSGVGVQYRGQLLLRVVRPLDRETKENYKLKISVEDKGQPPLKGVLEVEIIVEDYNDNSPVFSPSKYTVRLNESNLPGFEVVKVYASDADAGVNQEVEYQFKKTRSVLENEFSIDRKSGSIQLTRPTSCHINHGDCTLVVEAFDHGSPSLSAYCYVTVHVIRINSFFPKFRINYVGSTDKAAYIEMGKATRKPLAIVHCQDDDQDPRDLIVVSIIGGNDENVFALERTHGNVHILRQIKPIYNINLQSYIITVRAIDNGNPPKQTTVDMLIRVNKANIYSPVFRNRYQSITVYRNASINSFIANFFSTDLDAGLNGKIRYSITKGDYRDRFVIEKESGLITLLKPLWFVKLDRMKLEITARDSGINSLETTGYLDLTILQSDQLHARIKSSCPTRFILDDSNILHSFSHIFIEDFSKQLELSNVNRITEIEFKIINPHTILTDFFIASNGSLYLPKGCRNPSIEILILTLLYQSNLIYKVQLSIETSPKMSNILCSTIPIVYPIELPHLFQYNKLLLEIPEFHARQFDGEFKDTSIDNNAYYVSREGGIYWRDNLSSSVHIKKLEIKYIFTHSKHTLTQPIIAIIYPPSSVKELINCSLFQSILLKSPHLVLLENILIKSKLKVEFVLPANISEKYIQIIDKNINLYHKFYSSFSAPTHFQLGGYTNQYFSKCFINLPVKPKFEFEKYYFQTNQNVRAASIGMIKIMGNSSSVFTNITGRFYQHFYYSIQEQMLVLKDSFADKNTNGRVFELRIDLFDGLSGGLLVSNTEIIIEFHPLFDSPIFSDPSYTFVIKENSLSHIPLRKISLIQSQNIDDYHLSIIEESFYGKWSIFSDGSLYLLSELDYEERKQYSFTVLAVNKKDQEKSTKVFVVILVQDFNDNAPIFSIQQYFFTINRYTKPNTTIDKVFAMDSDSGINGFINYSIEKLPIELDFVEIDSHSGRVFTNKLVDVMEQEFTFFITAEDYGIPRRNSSVKVYLKIIPSPKSRQLFEKQTLFLNISEDTKIGEEIFKLRISHQQMVTYRITKCTEKGTFAINQHTGTIYLITTLDRESIGFHVLTIVATDNSSTKGSEYLAVANLYINLIDTNDNSPMFKNNLLSNFILSESIKVGTILDFYTANDRDDGLNGQVRYRLTTPGMESISVFKIDAFSGALYLNQPVDYELKQKWNFIVTAFDLGYPVRHSNLSVIVTITNINDEKPRFNKESRLEFSVQQNVAIGTTVGRVYAQDPDSNRVLYYLQSVHPPDHPFVINPISGILSVSNPILQEDSFDLVVMAIDAERQDCYDQQSVKVHIKHENEDEIQVLTYGAIILPKSSFYREKIATLKVQSNSRNPNSRFMFSLKNSSYDKIIIQRYTGEVFLTSTSPVEFNSIDITFLVSLESLRTDTLIKYHTTKLVLNQPNPHNLNFQRNDYFFQIPECKTTPGLKLLRLQALYPGNPISDLEYYIYDIYCGISERIRLPNTIIRLDKETGWISIGNIYLDREIIEGSQITVEVVVIDRGKNGSRIRCTKVFLNIEDCNDNRPVFANETFIFHAPENTTYGQRIYVGTVQAHDKDLDSMLDYIWINGIPEFSIDKTSGIITTTGIPLDHESVPYFIGKIQVSDGTFTSTASIIILIDDANDQCHNFTNNRYHFQIQENAPIHTVIGKVTLTNSSTNRNFVIKFTIISEWGKHLFSVNPDHGIITTQVEIDYEQEDHYILLITATDVSQQSLFLPCPETVTTTVLVSIVDINDNIPVFDNARLSVSIPENVPINSEIIQLLATDADKSDLLLFEILSPNDDLLMTVNPITGVISTAGILDYEKNEKHVLTVCCSDGLHRVIVEVLINLVNVNDETPIIYNPTTVYFPKINQKHNIMIKCSDQDNLDPLSYDIMTSSKDIQNIHVNRKTGKVSFNPGLFYTNSINVSLYCSDTIHNTMKNVSLRILDRNLPSKNYTTFIELERFEMFLKIQNVFDKLLIPNDDKYVYFLLQSRYNLNKDDYNFYLINPSTGEVKPIEGFVPRKYEYRFTITGIKRDSMNQENQINIETILTYKEIELCYPRFLGTPYSFQIVKTQKYLGSVSVGYCSNQKILYYLSSGHSFFYVNGTSGEIFITRDLPLGQYKFKLSSLIDTNPKTYLSTIVTVYTIGPRTNGAKCEFSTLRLSIDSSVEVGTKIGKISITNLPTQILSISYKLSRERPLSITDDGSLIISSKSFQSKTYFNLSARLSWWDRNEHRKLNCPIELVVNSRSSNCVLGIVYPGRNIETYTYVDQMNAKRFIFGVPVTHLNCPLKLYDSKFELNDPNFYITPKTGEIFSLNVLAKSIYNINVRVSSVNAINSLVIPVTVFVIDKIDNAKIEFNKNQLALSLFWKTPVKSVVTSVKALVVPLSYQSLLEYSVVYFCCIYSMNVAIYNGTITQTFFAINRESGDIILNEPLPQLSSIYNLRIRASLKMGNSKILLYKDTDVSISVYDNMCKCKNQGYFTGSIEENSDSEIIVSNNILSCSGNNKVSFTLHPKWSQDYLYYNAETNEIRTAHKPIDREVYNNLEISVNITDQSGSITDSCPGIIKVIDLNDNSPTFILNYFMGFVSENALIGTWIIDIGVIDADSKLFPLKFSLQGEENNVFSINSQNGSVFLAKTVDREQKSKYEMKVAVSDGINVLEIGMLITVTDSNDNRPQISKEIMNKTFVIHTSEFAHGNIFVVNITATDADDSQSNNSKIRYSLSSENQRIPVKSLFLLDEDSGSLTIKAVTLNWISDNETVDVIITASDRGQPPLFHSITTHFLFITAEYELRILKTTFEYPIAVLYTSQEGSRVANIDVNYDNIYGEITYFIISGNGSSFFTIDSKNGQISTNRNVNSAVMGQWFSLIVQACGNKRLSSVSFCSKRETITFVISDFNLYSPQIRISETTISISELIKVGSNLLQVDVIDPDVGLGGIVKITIMTSTDDRFSLIPLQTNGNSYQLKVANPLDYEIQHQYSLTLLAHDLGFPRKSQTSIVIIKVLDEDDNSPYFISHNFVVSLREIDQIIILPEIRDEDSIMASRNEPSYTLKSKTSSEVQLFQSKTNLTLKIVKRSTNESIINLTLDVFGSSRENYPKRLPLGRYSKLMIYLILPKIPHSQIHCIFKEINSGNDIKYVPVVSQDNLVYNLLRISPKLPKQFISVDRITGYISMKRIIRISNILISASMPSHVGEKYQICHISHSTSTRNIVANNIIIENDIKYKQIVGTIIIDSNPQIKFSDINLRIYSSHYLPFFITQSGEIMSTDSLFLKYPTSYNVLLMVSSKVNEYDKAETQLVITVRSNPEKKRGLSISLNVRENIGDGAILGSVQSLMKNNLIIRSGLSFPKEYFDSTGHLSIDRKGIIRIRKSIDKESIDSLMVRSSIELEGKSELLTLTVNVNDENDSESKSRIADILISIAENAFQLTRIAQLLPIDPDTTGDFQCRLDTLNVPLGVLITPDCWLHIINTSSAIRSMNNSYIRIIHHDGYHNAVMSTFKMKVNIINNNNIQKNWIVFKIPNLFITSLVKNLKAFKDLLTSLNVDIALMAIETRKNYLVIWPTSLNKEKALQVIKQNKDQLEVVLKIDIQEKTIKLCNKKLCNSHGLCSTEVKVNYEQVFTDENSFTTNIIHIYPSVNFNIKCFCDDGFLGEKCGLHAKCRQQICHNGGVCGVNRNSEAICECAPGYTGYNCEYDINECEKTNLCSPHGNCNNILGGFKCECQLNWIGNGLCTQPFNHCSSNPCSEMGTERCIPILGGFKCRCHFGNYGDRCQYTAISFPAESYMEMDFQRISKMSLEFSTILKDTPLISITISSSVIIQVSLSSGCIRLSIFEDSALISQRDSNKVLSNGNWWKLHLNVHPNNILVSAVACKDWNQCDHTTDQFKTINQRFDVSLSMGTNAVDSTSVIRVLIGSIQKLKLSGFQYFVGCVRNLQFFNNSIIRNEQKSVLFDSCPRYRNGLLPCSNPDMECGKVGRCIDEWFVSRCECPQGYQPPSCTPGYSAYGLASNTIISFVKRPKSDSTNRNSLKNLDNNLRKKRAISPEYTMISIRIRTRDSNSIIFMALSSFHSYTLVQLENGLVKVIDKYAGSYQEMLHKVVTVNDNKIHTITVTRHGTGTVSVTVDFVVAQVNWLQSHDILGHSVNEVYLAGLPDSKKIENSLSVPNFVGCISDVRFNNKTMPLRGLSENFNVSIIQGSVTSGCSSNICRQSGVCGKYQKCLEIDGIPHAIWGQYKCIDDNKYRLLSVLLPVLVVILLCVVFSALLAILIKKRAKKRKSKMSIDPANREGLLRKTESVDYTDSKGKKKFRDAKRSLTSSTLMQEYELRNVSHPDLIRSHEVSFEPSTSLKLKSKFDSNYCQDSTIHNPYISSGNITIHKDHHIKSTRFDPLNSKNLRFFNSSSGTIKTDDSLIYQCSRPDDYEAVGSHLSSNTSQDQLNEPKFPFAYQFQTQGIKSDFHAQNKLSEGRIPRHCDIRQSSSSSSAISHKPRISSRKPVFSDKRKTDEIFSNTESNFTNSPHQQISLESLSSSTSSTNSQNEFTPTNSSESIPSNKNSNLPNTNNCWKNIQRALPPPPPSEDQYEYADMKTN